MCRYDTFFSSEPWSRRSRSYRFQGALEPEPSKCGGSRILVKIIINLFFGCKSCVRVPCEVSVGSYRSLAFFYKLVRVPTYTYRV